MSGVATGISFAALVLSAAGVSGFSLMGATVDPSVTVFMALPGFFGTTVVLSVSGVTGPVLAIVAAITMSAMGVAGVMCAAEVSEVTLSGFPSVCVLSCLGFVLPWVSFLYLSVIDASGVSFAALVMGAAGVRRRSSHRCHWCLGSCYFPGLLGSRIPLCLGCHFAVNVTDAAGFSVTTHVLGSALGASVTDAYTSIAVTLSRVSLVSQMSHLPGFAALSACHRYCWGLGCRSCLVC